MRHGDHHGDWCIMWQREKKHHRTMLKILWRWLHLNVNSCLQTLYSHDMHVRSVGRRISGEALYEIIFALNVAKNLNFTAICVHIRHTKREIWSDTLLCSISWKCRVEVGISYCGSEWHSLRFMDRCCHISISMLNISSAQHSDFQSVIGVSLICMLLPGSVLWHKDIFSSGWGREGGKERSKG